MVSGLTYKTSIHFECIFVYGVRRWSSFIFLQVSVQFSQHHLLNKQSLANCMCLLPLSNTKCPSGDKWIKPHQDIYTMEYYSAVKKKEFCPLRQYGLAWRTLYQVKYTSQRKTNTMQFHLYVESNEQTELTSKIETDSQIERAG